MLITKQYARRSIVEYVSPYEDPFSYHPIQSLARNEILNVLANVQKESDGRDVRDESPAKMFDDMVEFAGSAFDPAHWLIAFDSNQPVGLVFSQRYHDKLHEGSIFLVGLVPEFRKRGRGKILHAKGLELLALIGCVEYVGSTDVNNTPMLKIFEKNGCRFTRTYDVLVESGVGRIENISKPNT